MCVHSGLRNKNTNHRVGKIEKAGSKDRILGNKLGNNKILRNNMGHRHNLGIGQQAGSETKYSVTRLGTDRIQGNKMGAQPEYWVRSWGHV